MPSKLTLQRLAENLIQESSTPFTADDFENKIQEKWQREIPTSTLKQLKKKLANHHHLIGTNSNNFLPVPVVLEKIKNISLSLRLSKFEINNKVFFPGHRLIPFIANDKIESGLTFLNPEGDEIQKQKQSFPIVDIVRYYQYSSLIHFPDEIKLNDWALEKSSLVVTAWNLSKIISQNQLKEGDVLLINLVDYKKGVFRVRPCRKNNLNLERLKMRSLFTSMEATLKKLCKIDAFYSVGLEKQLLYTLYHTDESLLEVATFSLTDFLESLTELEVVACEEGGGRLVSGWRNHPGQFICEEQPRISRGETGSLGRIFGDLGLAFTEEEFLSILYTVIGSGKYKLEWVFNILFGGEGKLFRNQHQNELFYNHLRKQLKKVYVDLKQSESKVITTLRNQTVGIKLSLIGILRFLEENEVGLHDLPPDLLEKIHDLDHFCRETLTRLADRSRIPELKFIHDARLAIKIILPHATALEEEIYSQLGFY